MSLVLLQDCLARSAERDPDRLALTMGEERLTYGELELASNRLARLLADGGCRRGDRVCLLLPKSPTAVAAMLGVLKVGAAYVPIDVSSPAARVERIVRACTPRLALACASTVALAGELARSGALRRVAMLDDSPGPETLAPLFGRAEWEAASERPRRLRRDPDALAHILFTSGSTGVPKGVTITHANVMHFIRWAVAHFGTSPEDRVSGHPPLHFDLSTFDIYGTLLAGAELHMVPAAANAEPAALVELIREHRLTQWFSVPSALTFMVKYGAIADGDFPELRRLIWCGEVMPTPTLIEWMRRLPHVTFTNLYGPTEATIASSFHTVAEIPADPTAPISIGRACGGEELVILDEQLRELPAGQTGEINIGGVGLSPGYWRDTEKTAAAFRPVARGEDGEGAGGERRLYRTGDLGYVGDDGLLYILGRIDSQIKSRGYRIELGEIEAALNAQPELEECAVVGVDVGGFIGTAICCAFSPRDGVEIAPSRLRERLGAQLPTYMLPSYWLSLEALPKNLNGKIDRRVLRERFEGEAAASPAKEEPSAEGESRAEQEPWAGEGSWAEQEPPAEQLDEVERGEALLKLVQEHTAELLLHLSPEEIEPKRAFKELGLDSLGAVELSGMLAAATGLELAPTLIFDHPTPAAVASHMCALVGGARESGGWAHAPRPPANGEEPIAIVGMSCRYPGGVRSPEDLWRLVAEERDAIGAFPDDRGWNLEALYHPDPDHPGTSYARHGGFVDDAGEFDARFFSIGPREALAMDPQQRLLLESAWEALEDAGLDPTGLHGTPTGVFAGVASVFTPDRHRFLGSEELEGFLLTGSGASVASGRIAYTLGLEGPAVSVDTACSSSLVAMHLACQSLRCGECSLALAGGVTVIATPEVFVAFSRQRALSPDGRCRSFAAAADGTGWAEGVGLLVLERLSEARRNGHPVLALVRASATNQDGASNGLTAPHGPSQQRVILRALAAAGLAPHEVDAVEAHGTATALGDPIEAQALLATYGQGRDERPPLWLGSVKSNIGHTQAAAGVAGVIKMVKALQHDLLPRTLHVDAPTNRVDWSTGAVALLTEAQPWPANGAPRRAAVSSFGVSGTNAHLILEEPPDDDARMGAAHSDEPPGEAAPMGMAPSDEPPSENTPMGVAHPAADATQTPLLAGALPWILSGRGPGSVPAQAARLRRFLDASPELDAADVALSLTARASLERRAVVVGADRDQLHAGLCALERGEPHGDVVSGAGAAAAAGERVVFMFPGQGSQWEGMAVELLDGAPAFAHAIEECGDALAPHVDWRLEDVLRGAPGAPGLDRVDVVQPALFAVMVSLAALWRACGVRPRVVIGHSQGEIAAACVAGCLSLEHAAQVVAARSLALRRLAGRGGMVSVGLSVAELRALIEPFGERVALAAINGPGAVVVSGEPQALTELLQTCHAAGVRARKIAVDYAAHSAQVETIRDELIAGCAGIAPRAGETPFYSTVTEGPLDGRELDAAYWYRNLRSTVHFAPAVAALLAAGQRTFVELSPHPVLAVGVQEAIDLRREQQSTDIAGDDVGGAADLPDSYDGQSAGAEHADADHVNGAQPAGGSVVVVGSLHRGDGGARRFMLSLAEAWAHGARVDWGGLLRAHGARRTKLPTYAFQRRRFWLSPSDDAQGSGAVRDGGRGTAWSARDALFGVEWVAVDTATGRGDDDTASIPGWAVWRPTDATGGNLLAHGLRECGIAGSNAGELVTVGSVAELDAAGEVGVLALDLTTPACAPAGEALPHAVRERTCQVLAVLQRWLSAERPAGARLVAVTRNAVEVGVTGALDLTSAGVWGLLRSAQAEHPGRLVLVDVDGEPGCWAALVDTPALDRQLQLGGQVAVRGGELLVPRMVPAAASLAVGQAAEAPATAALGAPDSGDPPAKLAAADEGVALVTGGTGTLGALVARHLVTQRGVRELVLASRRGPAAAGAAELREELTALGARVRIVACDVGDRRELAALVESIGERLAIVVHAAGTLRDGLVESLTSEQVAGMLSAKVAGAWHLHELTQPLGVREFVLFSSATGVLGNAGQAGYAAANAWLDALACNRRALGLPAVSIAWGLWAPTSEMTGALGAGDRARIERLGIVPLAARRGLELLDAARASERALVVALELDRRRIQLAAAGPELPRLLRQLAGDRPAGALQLADGSPPGALVEEDGTSLRRQLDGLPPRERLRIVVELVRRHGAAVLGHASMADVPSERAFKDLGFDSLAGVQLANRLRIATGAHVPATAAFDHPTPVLLARELLARMADERPAVRTAASPAGRSEEPIAIVGMSCRLPGGVHSPGELWELLAAGADAIGALPSDRGWDLERLYDPDPDHYGTSYARDGGFLADAGEFDAALFGISPREALAMDPQQRLLLEACWEAIERAGIPIASLKGSPTGTFVGASPSHYAARGGGGSSPEPGIEGYWLTGTALSVVSGRVAYTFGLEGPAVAVDTACSSSLVALHLACGALRGGECSLALAGGVTVLVTPDVFIEFSRQRGLARDGRCKPFADAADGTGWGEGVGVLLLERLSDARRNGHPVLAVVRGSAVNQDGASNGLSAPNGPSQQRVIQQALANAALSPWEVDAVEAHGTGTTLGDPIEAQALLATYGQGRGERPPLWLGSVKSNIGHTQSAAGVAGVIKMVMALQRGLLPPTLHVDRPSQRVAWEEGAVALLTEQQPWVRNGKPRRAGVSAFGISGTNAHVILEEAPAVPTPGLAGGAGSAPDAAPATAGTTALQSAPATAPDAAPATASTTALQSAPATAPDAAPATAGTTALQSAPATAPDAAPATASTFASQPAPATAPTHPPWPLPWVLSGCGAAALRAQAARLRGLLASEASLDPADVAFSLAGRSPLADRAVLLGENAAELRDCLDALAAGRTQDGMFMRASSATATNGGSAFLFTGQGTQRVGMGRELYEAQPVFRAAFDEVCGSIDRHLGRSLKDVVFGDASQPLHDTALAQPALFALEVALYRLLEAWGVRPDFLIGHSVGELAAAHVAGVFSLDDACRLVAARGRLMGALPEGGAMVAIAASEAEAIESLTALENWRERVALAAVNSPESVVASGEEGAVLALARDWKRRGRRTRRLGVSHAFHSPRMDAMLHDFRAVLETVDFGEPTVPLVSNLSGRVAVADELCSVDYWVRHVRETVRFADGVRWLLREGVSSFLELGPDGALSTMVEECVEGDCIVEGEHPVEGGRSVEGERSVLAVPTLRAGEPETRSLCASLAQTWVRGVAVDWAALFDGFAVRRVALPTYAFQRERFWLQPAGADDAHPSGASGGAAERELWEAVRGGDVDRLAQTLGAGGEDERESLAAVLPMLAGWRTGAEQRRLVDGWRYRVAWTPLRERAEGVFEGAWPVLVWAGSVERQLADGLVRALAARGARAVVVELERDCSQREALASRLRKLLEGELAGSALGGVLSLLALDGAASPGAHLDGPVRGAHPRPSAPGVDSSVATAGAHPEAEGLLTLAQALGELGVDAPLWCVTRGAVSVGGSDPVAGAAGGLVWGLGRTIALEHPDRWGGLIDLPPVADERVLSQLVAALARGGEDELAVRGAGAFARRLTRAPQRLAPPAGAYRPRGTVLITGGTGALGGHLARWLAEAGAEHILLASRRGADAHGAAELVGELQRNGARASVVRCDAAEREQLERLLAGIPDELPLSAVFHAAGITESCPVERLPVGELRRGLAAKADGAWHLHELTQAMELERFVVFSSIAGVMGSGGQGAYSAANAFLDALIELRRARGLPGVSVAWGAWAGAGMAAHAGELLDRQGIREMSPQLALGALRGALEADESAVVVADLDWERYALTYSSARARPLIGDLPAVRSALESNAQPAGEEGRRGLAERLAGVPAGEHEHVVVELVRERVAAVLGHAASAAVAPHSAFKELGFDSLAGVQLARQLREATGLRVPATAVFDHPTPASLGRHLLAQVAGERPAIRVEPPAHARSEEPIAIVGMSCRLPGGVHSPGELWELLAAGGDAIGDFPPDRGWDLEALYDPDPDRPGTTYAREGGFLADAGAFDAALFGISPREALAMDPQQRLLLEGCWEAIEHAGIPTAALRGSATGVFVGVSPSGYTASRAPSAARAGEGFWLTGTALSVVSGRVAYTFGLEGPAVALDTACSSSLVALHLACGALRGGECSLALAGGVTVLVTPDVFVEFSRQRGLAPDGRCKPFADAADGTGWGEGVGVLLLERLRDAERNGHRVLAVVRGSAVNQDGASNGLSAPNGPSQQRVIRQALANAGLSAHEVDVVEAHGTGTTLGDPIEAQALLATYGRDRGERPPLWLGSVKSNIGHTQAAAGVAGVIKMVMALQREQLPRTLHVDRPSARVAWEEGAVALLTEPVPWARNGKPRRAAVSAFGISGTNAHAILEEAPAAPGANAGHAVADGVEADRAAESGVEADRAAAGGAEADRAAECGVEADHAAAGGVEADRAAEELVG